MLQKVTPKDQFISFLKNKIPFPQEDLFYTQDGLGNLVAHKEMPTKEGWQWMSEGKIFLSKQDKQPCWHNVVIEGADLLVKRPSLPSGVTFGARVHKPTVSKEREEEMNLEASSLVEFYDNLPDLAIAKSYCLKAQQARTRGIEFDLTYDQFKELYTAPVCAYSGVPVFSGREGLPDNQTRSVERIDPLQGYVASNCVAITKEINCKKSPLDQFLLTDLPFEIQLKILRKAVYRVEQHIKWEKAKHEQG